MSPPPAPKGRRYRDYSWVVLASPVKCPMRNVTADNFPGTAFLFFFEDGLFCVECRRNGIVFETAPGNLREARRKTAAELEKEHQKELEKALVEATA